MARRGQRLLNPSHAEIQRLRVRYGATQWSDKEILLGYQEQKLRELFAHCWHNVPYYRRAFEQAGLNALEDVSLTRVPLLTRSIVRHHFDALKSRDMPEREWYTNHSGGSTGEPLTLIQDEEYRVHSIAKKDICFEWAGYRSGKSLIKLWGSERDILEGGVGFKANVASFLDNRIVLNAFRMTPESMERYLAVIHRERPDCILAYAHAIFELAKFARKHGISVDPPGVIVSTSGTLYSFMRETIEQAFGCPVFDQYGSREVSSIASECELHEGLHLNMETLVVEVLTEEGQPCLPGVEGDIAVTSLLNYAMPLIRYKIGDRGVLSDRACACGRGLTLLESVTGRTMDCLRREDGAIIPAEYFIHFLGVVFNTGWIEKVQVVQEAYERVQVRVVAQDGTAGPKEVEEVARTVRLAMGDGCRVDVDFVDDIPSTDSGKYRYTICNIPETEL